MTDVATETVEAAPEEPRLPCLCGCGQIPTRKKSRFMPGHDAQLKAALYRTIRNPDAPVADQESAQAQLTEFGWPQPAPKAPRKTKAQKAADAQAEAEAVAATA
jgi:hypothetical protein